ARHEQCVHADEGDRRRAVVNDTGHRQEPVTNAGRLERQEAAGNVPANLRRDVRDTEPDLQHAASPPVRMTPYFLPDTNLFGVPPSGPPGAGFQSTVSSILRASAKSLSVMPPAEWVFSLTHTLPQVTFRSAWCHAASHR